MTKIKDKNVLITGGASGIGKILAERALELGAAKLIIWDIDKEKLEHTTRELRSSGFTIFSYRVDVADTAQVKQYAKQVKDEAGEVDLLINNAGVVVGKYFHEHTHQEIDFTMNINSSALMHISLEFIQGMLEKGEGHIVNIASAAGMVANPKMSIYCASKWSVIGWSDSLRLEMEQMKQKIKVTTVTPYYISTGMFEGVKSRIIPIVKPEKAARKIIRGIQKNRIFIRMPRIIYCLPAGLILLWGKGLEFIIQWMNLKDIKISYQ